MNINSQIQPKNSLIPMVVEQQNGQERSWDLYSRMMKERIVFLNGVVDETSISILTAQMLFLEAENPKADINLYISSPGGSVYAGLQLYDIIQTIRPDVASYTMGCCASMGSFLGMVCTRGKRFILKSARTMVHSVSSGSGKATVHDLRISMNETEVLHKYLTQAYADHCPEGGDFDAWAKRMERDCYLSAEETIALGLADKIVTKRVD